MPDDRAGQTRRTVITAALLGAAYTAMSGCTPAGRTGNEPAAAPNRSSSGGRTVLLAYFSRAGENYFNGGRRFLTVGNTQVVAETIGRLIGCDLHRIEAADPYPDDYTASCPGATLGEGLAVRGENVADAGPAVEAWLGRIGLLAS